MAFGINIQTYEDMFAGFGVLRMVGGDVRAIRRGQPGAAKFKTAFSAAWLEFARLSRPAIDGASARIVNIMQCEVNGPPCVAIGTGQIQLLRAL